MRAKGSDQAAVPLLPSSAAPSGAAGATPAPALPAATGTSRCGAALRRRAASLCSADDGPEPGGPILHQLAILIVLLCRIEFRAVFRMLGVGRARYPRNDIRMELA